METDKPMYWFPAKKYGWGWGPPACWQGWVVTAVWFALVVAGAFFIMPHTVAYLAYSIFMCAILSLICYLKGEKPRWRWGKD